MSKKGNNPNNCYTPPKRSFVEQLRYHVPDLSRSNLVEEIKASIKYQEILKDFFDKNLKLGIPELRENDIAQMGADLLTYQPACEHLHEHLCPELPEFYVQEVWKEDVLNKSIRNRQIHGLRINLQDISHTVKEGLSERYEERAKHMIKKKAEKQSKKEQSSDWNDASGGFSKGR